jgi:glycosyltransferase involved in cell wall biosynthesis
MAVLGPSRCHVPDKRSRSSWQRWMLSSMAKPAGSRRQRPLGPPAEIRSRAEEVRTRRVSALPRLSIGLPVYNGERHIGEALESLLGQTYEDFELIVSDNASTDSTSEICLHYARQDRRIRYIRQERNIGLIPNHVFLIEQARGELFKSAAHDDLYGRDLLLRCVQALDDDPKAVLAHPWSAMVDSSGSLVGTFGPGAALDAPRAPDRFRSVLYEGCHDYEYGIVRTATLRRVRQQGSYHLADRMFNVELVLHGGFRQVEEWLYFRREHQGSMPQNVRDRCATLDPRRANRLRHPVVRLYGEYLWACMTAIGRAPLSLTERGECFGILSCYLGSRAVQVMGESRNGERLRQDPLISAPPIPVDLIVPGRGEMGQKGQPRFS